MARRRGPGRWSEDQYDELGLGRLFDSQRWRMTCTRPEWCPKCSNGWSCGSFFADRDEMEQAYWDLREALLADELLTNRPRSWWMFEAPLLCAHEPPCDAPQTSDARDRWLDYHDQLTARERALLAAATDE